MLVKDRLSAVAEQVGEISFTTKRNQLSQEDIDQFLDSILLLKKRLITDCDKLDTLVNLVESITWFDRELDEEELNEEELKMVHDIVTKLQDLYSSFNRRLHILKSIKERGIATDYINNLRDSIDSLKECSTDLEAVYFNLPQIPEYKEAITILLEF